MIAPTRAALVRQFGTRLPTAAAKARFLEQLRGGLTGVRHVNRQAFHHARILIPRVRKAKIAVNAQRFGAARVRLGLAVGRLLNVTTFGAVTIAHTLRVVAHVNEQRFHPARLFKMPRGGPAEPRRNWRERPGPWWRSDDPKLRS